MNNVLKKKLKDIFIILSIPSFISFLLLLWFILIEYAGYNFILNNYGYFDNNTFIGSIENGFYRTISHIDYSHLRTNILSFFIFTTMILNLQKLKYYIIQLVLFIISSSMVLTYYPTGMGFSMVTNSLYSTAFIICLYSLILSSEQYKKFYYGLIIYILILIYLLRQLIYDILLVLDISTMGGYSFLNIFSITVSDNYSVISAEVHLIGFLIGIITILLNFLYVKIFNQSLFVKL